MVAGPNLSKKHGAAHRNADRESNDYKQGRQQYQRQSSDGEIQSALAEDTHCFSVQILQFGVVLQRQRQVPDLLAARGTGQRRFPDALTAFAKH